MISNGLNKWLHLFTWLPSLLCAADMPEFTAALHEWEAEMAKPGQPAARDLPEVVRRILALEPSERDAAQSTTLAEFFRAQQDRVAAARITRGETVRTRFQKAGLPYPPREIFLRAFKHEGELELWAREQDDAFRLVASYRVTARSGGPGPKRREGDRQVPEGCYVINAFNPKSRFHLSLGLDYPNAADRVLADPKRPGGEIYIHGSDQTIGCLPLGNPAIEELYLTALDTRARGPSTIHVHIFPACMTGPSWTEFVQRETASRPELRAFWDELQPIHDAFERTRLRPRVSITAEGHYRIPPSGNPKFQEPNSK